MSSTQKKENSSQGAPDQNSNEGSPHFPKEHATDDFGSFSSAIIPSSKDVFRGQVLVNRLLVYYSKFAGSREKATRYAQKLLDLGHIESLTLGRTFEDSAHVYRWTDVAQVMNRSKVRAEGAVGGSPEEEKVRRPLPRTSPPGRRAEQEKGKAILKISIETDNCDGAEIQARIRAQPRSGKQGIIHDTLLTTKSATAVTEDSFFGHGVAKALSYVSEPTANEIPRATSPIITELSPSPVQRNKSAEESPGQIPRDKSSTKPHTTSDKNKTSSVNQKKSETTSGAKTTPSKPKESQGEPAVRKSLFGNGAAKPARRTRKEEARPIPPPVKSATEPALVVPAKAAPGPAASDGKSSNKNKCVTTKSGKDAAETSPRGLDSEKGDEQRSLETEKAPGDKGRVLSRSEHNGGATDADNATKPGCDKKPQLMASTQTSEKSILRASKLYSPRGGNASGLDDRTDPASRDASVLSNGNDSQKVVEQKKKTRFADEQEHVLTNGEVQRNPSGLTSESTEMSLHSSGIAEDANIEALSLHIPLSPPPPSPTSPHCPSSPVQQLNGDSQPQMKSLFWSKIDPRRSSASSPRPGRVFWDEVEDLIAFNQEEFERLFSRPPAAQPSPRGKNGRSPKSQEPGKRLKVLGVERSRHVEIRASTVRLPVEAIHDAVINMDDEQLDIDGLQALFDIRPTAEELDEIADTLKLHPKGILDKPEQFILMLAMIPNLDDRLECWMFAKRFPDKMVEVEERLNAMSEACQQIVQNATLRRVLETVLLLGNHMNKGTQRGNAFGFHLDILPKLKDVKTKGCEGNLLQYMVKTVREQMKAEGKLSTETLGSPRLDDTCGLPDHDVIVRAVATSLGELGDELEATAVTLERCKRCLLPDIVRGSTIPAESEMAQEKLEEFFEKATVKMREQAQLYQSTLDTCDEFQNYYVPTSSSESRESLTSMLESIALFCEDFRFQWREELREEVKEQFYKLERGKRQRLNALRITSTPSALKERFMERRRRDRRSRENSREGRSSTEPKPPRRVLNIAIPGEAREPVQNGHNGLGADQKPVKTGNRPRRTYKFLTDDTSDSLATSNGGTGSRYGSAGGRQRTQEEDLTELANQNSKRLQKRMMEWKGAKHENGRVDANAKREDMLPAKTC